MKLANQSSIFLICLSLASATVADFDFFGDNSQNLSSKQQFQLKFIHEELEKHPQMFQDNWDSTNAQIVIENADLAVQNSSKATRSSMKSKIIEFFKQINVDILFTSDDFIVKVDGGDDNKNSSHFQRNDSGHDLDNKSKKRLKKKTTDDGLLIDKPKKIHGARRTLRRLKEKWAAEEKEKRDKELAREKKIRDLRNKEGSGIKPAKEHSRLPLSQDLGHGLK